MASPCLVFADAMHEIERFEQSRGNGHGAIDAGAALLEALEDQGAGGEIDPIGGERQRLGQPAAGIGQGHAEGAYLAVSLFGGAQEGVALAGGEIFARPSRGVQLHAGRGGGGCFPSLGPGVLTSGLALAGGSGVPLARAGRRRHQPRS
jgi:hypothetical protein